MPCRRSVSRSFMLLIGVASCSALAADTLDRLQPDALKATHEAVEALKAQRREVSLDSGFNDVRTLLHVHSAFSHDSRGTVDEIVAAAKQAGVRVIMFSEHPAPHYDYVRDGHRGLSDGVLLIPGAETGGFLAYPRQSIQDRRTETPQQFCDLVRSTGGLAFVSHIEERLDWQIAGVNGMEIYNTHADFKEDVRFLNALRSPLMMLNMSAVVAEYPQEVFGALLDYPADYLKRYDELCQRAPHTGVAANDAHHNQAFRARILDDGQLALEDILGSTIARIDPQHLPPLNLLTAGKKPGDIIFNLDLDPYARSFLHVSTHLLVTEVSEVQVWKALEAGRAYIAFDWIADPTGFFFQAKRGAETWPMGSEAPLVAGMHLQAEAPQTARFRLVCDGSSVLDVRSASLDYAVTMPGVYRVEVWLDVAGELRPWILTNPIYIRAPGAGSEAGAAAGS